MEGFYILQPGANWGVGNGLLFLVTAGQVCDNRLVALPGELALTLSLSLSLAIECFRLSQFEDINLGNFTVG